MDKREIHQEPINTGMPRLCATSSQALEYGDVGALPVIRDLSIRHFAINLVIAGSLSRNLRRVRRPKELIRRMKTDNPGWGAPRIHGELLALGLEVSELTVSRYLQQLKTSKRPGRKPSGG
jgi:hypothetical protein